MISTMVLCFALTVSVAVSIGLASILGIQVANANMLIAVKEMFASINKFPLAAIPFFILAGNLMETGGISRRLVEFAKSIVGGVQGGLPMTCVLTCMIFAAVSGSSVATTFAIGAILIPALIKHGYPTSYAAALQATSAELGVIIPPSIPMILYGVSAEVSIGELFIAGFGPGILISGALMLFVWVYCKWKGWGKHDGEGRLSFGKATWQAGWALLMPVIILGGIYGGIFTPTEGAAIGATLTFIITLLQRKLTLQKAVESIRTTAVTSGMIFMIFIGADMMNAALALSQLPNQLADLIAHAAIAPVVVMAVIMLFYVVLGCVMDEMSMILLTVPVIFPVIMGLDFFGLEASDKALWFGILILTVCAIGMIFPPVGLNVYVMNGLAKDVPMIETYKGVMIFLAWDFIRLALLILFPGITLWLVHLLT